MPLILAPRPIDLYEFQARQGCIPRACLKTNKQRRHVSLDFPCSAIQRDSVNIWYLCKGIIHLKRECRHINMVVQKCHGPPKEKDMVSLYARQHAWWSVLQAVGNIAMVTSPASCLTLPLCWPPPSAFTLTDQEWDQSHSLCIRSSLWFPGFVPFKIFLLISWAFQGVYFDHIHTPPTHHLSFCRNCPISLSPKMLHPLLLYNNPSTLIYAVQYSGHKALYRHIDCLSLTLHAPCQEDLTNQQPPKTL